MELKAEAARCLDGKVAVVTGGAGPLSIGRAISLRFAQEGAKTAVVDINVTGAEEVAEEIRAFGGTAVALQCDVRDLAECEAMVDKLAAVYDDRIDILVNNAAAFKGFVAKSGWKAFDEWTPEEWDHLHAVNLRGQWFCARAVFPYMMSQGYGKIINVGSTSFFEGIPGFIHYISSKGGVIGLTRGLGKELGRFGIRVNTLCPGFTITDASMELIGKTPQAIEARRSRRAIRDRNLMPEDMAGPAVFLASEDSDMVTCQTLIVQGGGSMW